MLMDLARASKQSAQIRIIIFDKLRVLLGCYFCVCVCFEMSHDKRNIQKNYVGEQWSLQKKELCCLFLSHCNY